jgi:ubiquinone/menaquinone biosynthesis C-methylase UbiE
MDAVYDKIASHFDKTRYSIWNCVRKFLDTIPINSFVADIGTGNGKNTRYRDDIIIIGNDISSNLVKIAQDKNTSNNDFLLANGINIPYRNNTFDAAISIAVLHHIDNEKERIKFISEILRIVKNNGRILITVWAAEQEIKPKWIHTKDNDYIIPWHLKDGTIENRYYHLFSKDEIEYLLNKFTANYSLYYEMDNWIININNP